MAKLIFFVDDDKMMLNLLEYTICSRQNFDVNTYLSGEECLENLDKKPDLIVLDHLFTKPGNHHINGLETLIRIRKSDKKVPVIILTSHDDPSLAEQYYRNGANKYLPKNDFFIDSLMQYIEEEAGV
jgi:CheY-like chemotaxis protein